MSTLKHTRIIGSMFSTTAEFKDFNKVKIYPSIVNLEYKKPTGDIVVVPITPVNNEYNHKLLLDTSGDWLFRWECQGNYASAEEFLVFVYDTSVQ